MSDAFRQRLRAVELGGYDRLLIVPMLKENELIGSFSLYRQEVRAFTDKQIELVKSFARQAVIAIENARLLNEFREALAAANGYAEVLKFFRSSRGELEPVFKALLKMGRDYVARATAVCGYAKRMRSGASLSTVFCRGTGETGALLRPDFQAFRLVRDFPSVGRPHGE